MKKYIMLLSALIMLLSCSSGNPTPSNANTGATAKVYDCDEQLADTAGTAKMPVAAETIFYLHENDDNVYFECIGENQLRIRYQEVINCAGTLEATSALEDNTITLTQNDIEGSLQANCICAHWLEYVLTDLPYGKYRIVCKVLYNGKIPNYNSTMPADLSWVYELDFSASTNISVDKNSITVKY